MRKIVSLLVLILFNCFSLHAQQDLSKIFSDSTLATGKIPVIATFKSGRLINAQTNETMHKHDLLFLVGHRFGDIGGKYGGTKTFFGLDNISDDLIGFEYGITDRFTVGAGRDKGAPNDINISQEQLWYGSLKYRLVQQRVDNSIPIAITLFGRGIVSSMTSTPNTASNAHFPNFRSRLSGVGQIIIARKFSEIFSLEVLPTYVRRERVTYPDQRNMLAFGFGGRLKLTKRMAIIADYFLPLRSKDDKDYFNSNYNLRFYNPLAVGLEIETGGHVFHINFTNATALLENQFIPGTTSDWTKGQFRWGFNFSRTFTIGEDKNKWGK